jgi:signal transduction histidine kinase
VAVALWSSLTRPGPSVLGADWERPGPDATQRRADVVVGVVVTAATIASIELSRSAGLLDRDPQPSWPEQLAWGAAIALPLAARRRFSLPVLAICSLVFLVGGIRAPMVSATFFVQVCFFASLYSAAAWGRDRRHTTALFGAVSLVMFAWVAVIIAKGGMYDAALRTERHGLLPPVTAAAVLGVVINVVYFLGAWLIGTAAWRAARQREELRLQTEQLAREQQVSAQRAVVADRVRIARELHDVVAHHVSLIGVQAAAARRTLDRDPDTAREALAAAEESSRRAVAEMRSLLGVLRSGDDEAGRAGRVSPERQPQPGLEQLAELAQVLGAQGLTVRLGTVGTPVDVPATIALTIYRIVQEALANVLRHSTARQAQVTVRHLERDGRRSVEVEVIDDGRPSGSAGGSGLGHVGMRERVALHGGEIETGQRPFGGYRVRARVPLTSRAAADVAAPAR